METSTPQPTYHSEAERPFTSPQDYYRLRDFGQKFEATIAFLRKHGPNLYRVLLVPSAAAVGVMVLFFVVMATSSLGSAGSLSGPFGLFALMAPYFTVFFVLLMAAFVVVFAMLYGFVKCRMYHPDPTAKLTVAEVWAVSRPYILPLLGYGLVALVIYFVAALFLVLPGFYVGVVFMLLPSVVVFEDAGLGQTLNRCFTLISGKWWSTFGLVFICSVATMMIVFALTAISGFLMLPLRLLSDSIGGNLGLVVVQGLQMGLQFLMFPVMYLLLMFQYFNLVERKDHVSLRWSAEQLGQTGAAPAATPDDNLFRPSYGDQTL
jgi:hypothetical protein